MYFLHWGFSGMIKYFGRHVLLGGYVYWQQLILASNKKCLLQDKEALQQQQYNNLIQISALQSKLDEARHRVPADSSAAPVLKEQLEAEQEALQSKEREVRVCANLYLDI